MQVWQCIKQAQCIAQSIAKLKPKPTKITNSAFRFMPASMDYFVFVLRLVVSKIRNFDGKPRILDPYSSEIRNLN